MPLTSGIRNFLHTARELYSISGSHMIAIQSLSSHGRGRRHHCRQITNGPGSGNDCLRAKGCGQTSVGDLAEQMGRLLIF
jgi:hypothetical protein